MKTSIYLPMVGFTIGGKDGSSALFEHLIQSGPAYELIVHESPNWLKLRDEIPNKDMIKIISEKEAQSYKDKVNDYFAPFHESYPNYYQEQERLPTSNLTMEYRRALSYILIGYDYNARIYDGDIVKEKFDLSKSMEKAGIEDEDVLLRTKFLEELFDSYATFSIDTVSTNNNLSNFKQVLDILDNSELQKLSESNQLFSRLEIEKNILLRDVQSLVTEIVQNDWIPLLCKAPLWLSFVDNSAPKYWPLIETLLSTGSKLLKDYDFRKQAPPIQKPEWYKTSMNAGVWTYTWFNYEFSFYVQKR